jgi:DNA-binding transcriptional regulator GbsR (MarR family)
VEADLNDWQRAVYEYILGGGPLTVDEVVMATGLPKKEIVPVLRQLEVLGLVLMDGARWRAL